MEPILTRPERVAVLKSISKRAAEQTLKHKTLDTPEKEESEEYINLLWSAYFKIMKMEDDES